MMIKITLVCVLALFQSFTALAQLYEKSSTDGKVSRRKNRHPHSGFEEVTVYVGLPFPLTEITDEELDYMSSSLIYTFDETSKNHTFHADFAYLDKMEEARRSSNMLRSSRYASFLYYLHWACDLCAFYDDDDDDYYLGDKESSLYRRNRDKGEKEWAHEWCSALQKSGLDGLKDAKDCLIELPKDGVHANKRFAAE